MGPDGSGRKVALVVDDNELNRDILTELIEMAGMRTDTASDGQEAFEKAAAVPDRYAIIFMDINMPRMNGYESARAIRKTGSEVPIIAVTSNFLESDIRMCDESGMNGYMEKPIDIEILRHFLSQLI